MKACISGAAPLPRAVAEEFEQVTGGAQLVEGYGLTEMLAGDAREPVRRAEARDDRPAGPRHRLPDRVARRSGQRGAAGERGELCIKGPQVMLGYWNKPEATAEMIRDGWLHTGDIAIMDDEGYFQIVDRMKDMIIVSGFNVYPTEVEEVLYRHPKVSKACVVGLPDDTTGERVKAYVVAKEGETLTGEELEAWCRDPAQGLTGLPRAEGVGVPRRAPRDADRQGAAARAAGGGAQEGVRRPRRSCCSPAASLVDMDAQLFRDAGLGNGSYLVDVGAGRAVLIDPDRRIRRYLEAAKDRGVEIVGVLDTHLHADFVSGALDLRAETGAELYEPAEAGVSFPHTPVKPGERLELGRHRGRGPVHARSLAGARLVRVPWRGRRDSCVVHRRGADRGRRGAERSRRGRSSPTTSRITSSRPCSARSRTCPTRPLLKPTHGGGSFCSAGSGKKHTSTLGEERQTNPLLSMDEQEFMKSWPASFPRTPAYFARMREINWAGPRLRTDIEMPRPLTPEAFAAAASQQGSLVVDVRDAASYAEAHGQGALAIPFRDAFPTWLGWLVPADARLLFVLGDTALEDVVDASLLVGLERFEGYLDGRDGCVARGRPARPLAARDRSRRRGLMDGEGRAADRRAGTGRARARRGRGRRVGAARGPAAASCGLPAGRPLLVYCASGMRSTTAASLLERAGVGPVVNLRGGYGAWQEAGRD